MPSTLPTPHPAHEVETDDYSHLVQSVQAGRVFLPSLPEQSLIPGRRSEKTPATEVQARPRSSQDLPVRLADRSTTLFRLNRLAGRGGVGEVWEGVQVSLGRSVAVKVVRADKLKAPASPDSNMLRAFRVEALTAARLEHPNILPVYDLGRDSDGLPMLAMKFARGMSWENAIAEDWEKLSPDDFLARHLAILGEVAQAVAFAHSRGVVHRDLKPAQVMLGEFGEVLLVDWGLALLHDPSRLADNGTPETLAELPTTATAHSPAGTPALMAPEQVLRDAQSVGPWTDVYLLGGTLYFLLTGTYPHTRDTPLDSMKHALMGLVDAPSRRAKGRPVPEELADLAMRALRRVPADRVADARAFHAEIQEYLGGSRRRRESRTVAATAAAILEPSPRDYATCARALAEIDRAAALWPSNPEVPPMRDRALTLHAEAALASGDLALARHQAERILAEDARASALAEVATAERHAAAARRQRHIALMLTFLLLGGILVGSGYYNRQLAAQRNEAEAAKHREVDARRDADLVIEGMLRDMRAELAGIGREDLAARPAARAEEYLRKSR